MGVGGSVILDFRFQIVDLKRKGFCRGGSVSRLGCHSERSAFYDVKNLGYYPYIRIHWLFIKEVSIVIARDPFASLRVTMKGRREIRKPR